jgi:hypothetical protein
VWMDEDIWVGEGAPWAYDSDLQNQGGTHRTFPIMVDEDFSCIC